MESQVKKAVEQNDAELLAPLPSLLKLKRRPRQMSERGPFDAIFAIGVSVALWLLIIVIVAVLLA